MNTDRERSEQQTKKSRWGFSGMTVREWLPLAIVPLAVAGFTFAQYLGQQHIERHRAEQATLQAYLEQMGTLLLQEDLRTTKDVDVRTYARARTLTTLLILGPHRKRAVIKFLYEASLINKDSPVVSLTGASLHDAKLSHIELGKADLSNANLSSADLWRAKLSGADLRSANLREADVSEATLRATDLTAANLSNANLRGADLNGAEGVTDDQLSETTSLEGATMPNGQKYEDWLKDKGRTPILPIFPAAL
jgi:uncharacterized protein YjbI with pentapeptide repeats